MYGCLRTTQSSTDKREEMKINKAHHINGTSCKSYRGVATQIMLIATVPDSIATQEDFCPPAMHKTKKV